MVKKGGIRFDDNEQVFMPIFGEQEIDVPEYLAEKTKKGYKLVPTLTKSGNITKRHKEPSIKIVAKNIEHITIPNNKVERLSLNEFIKKSKLELEKQYADFIKLQQKIVDAEMTEILKMPEVHAAIMESDDKAAAIEEIRKVVETEIYKPTYSERLGHEREYKNVIDEMKTKSGKKLTLGRLEEKIRYDEEKLMEIVKKEKPLMLKRAKKQLDDSQIPLKRFNALRSYINSDYKYFSPAIQPTPENRYLYEGDGFISKTTANKYYKLISQRNALQEEFDRRKQENKNRRLK
jgi:hypothetical protein